jgi:hypothetical protein
MAENKRLVAAQPIRYNRRDMVAGEVFYAPVVDASYLMRTGKAKPSEEAVRAPVAAPPAVAPVKEALPDVAGHSWVPAETPTGTAGSSQATPEEPGEGVGTTTAPRRRYTARRAPAWSPAEPGSAE